MGNEISDAFASAFRYYQVDGVPSSGKNKTKKSDAIAAGQVVQDVVDAVVDDMDGFTADVAAISTRVDELAAGQGKGSVVSDTLANLVTLAAAIPLNNTDDRGRLMSVYADPDPTKNGDYQWSGTAPVFLGLGRLGKLEAAVASPVEIFGDNKPMVFDYDGWLGTAQTVYIPRRIFARIGSTTLNGSYGTESTELAGYVKLALGDTDHSAIYLDLDDATHPVKFTNYPTEPTQSRLDRVKVLAEIFGRNFKSDLPWVALTDSLRDRVHFTAPLVVESTKLFVPSFFHRRAGNSAVLYSPADGSHYWQSSISTNATINNHLINILAAQAGSNPVVTVAGSGGPTFADNYLFVEFATSQNRNVATQYQIRGNVPGGSVPNQFRRGRQPDLCRLFNSVSLGSASLVDVVDTTLLSMGFTKAVTGSGAFYGATFEELPPKKGYVFFRLVIRRASDGTWPAAPYFYLRSGDDVEQSYGGAIEQQVNDDIRIQYTYSTYDFAEEPVWWWIGGFQPTGTQDAQFTGAQVYVGAEPRGWIMRDDWPDILDDRLIIGPDLWLIEGRPLPIFLDSITGSRWASKVDRILTVDSYDPSDRSALPSVFEGRSNVIVDTDSVLDIVNLTVLDRTDREQRAVASMNVHKAPATVSGSKKILCLGDSTTFYSLASYVKDKLNAIGMTVTALGTLLDADGTPSEGRSSWKWADVSHDETTYALPSSAAAYIGYSQTGTGPTTRHDYNPFINPSTMLFDPAYYMSTYSVAAADCIPIGLGTNDEREDAITLSGLLSQISSAFDKIVPPLLSALPSAKLGLWIPSRPYARDSDQLWQAFRRETVNLLIGKRDTLVSGGSRVDIIPVWAHMSPVAGWELINSPSPADGAKLTAVDDSLHQHGVNRHLVGEAVAAWVACKVAGV